MPDHLHRAHDDPTGDAAIASIDRKVGRPVEYGARTNTSVRLDPELHAALKRAAKERELSVNVLVNLAVKELLPRLIPVDELRLTRD